VGLEVLDHPTRPRAADDVEAATADYEILLDRKAARLTSADGKPLPAGVYQVKLTAQEAKPDAKGASENIERWVEFSQKGTVKGREVVSIVPQNEVKNVVKDAPPAANGAPKVQMLKGNDYLRVWFNKGGNHYLIYFPAAAAS